MSEKNYHVLGKDHPRKDGAARVTGQERYPSDVSLPGMLHGKILRSPHPHAVVKRIDFSRAEEMDAQVLSFDEVPSDYFNLRQVSIPRSTKALAVANFAFLVSRVTARQPCGST